jgi:hypothetical protein
VPTVLALLRTLVRRGRSRKLPGVVLVLPGARDDSLSQFAHAL